MKKLKTLTFCTKIISFILGIRIFVTAQTEPLKIYIDSENYKDCLDICSGLLISEPLENVISGFEKIELMEDIEGRSIELIILSSYNPIEESQLNDRLELGNAPFVYFSTKKYLNLSIRSSDVNFLRTISFRTFRISLAVSVSLSIKSLIFTNRDIVWMRSIPIFFKEGADKKLSECKMSANKPKDECCQHSDYLSSESFCFIRNRYYFSVENQIGLQSLIRFNQRGNGVSVLHINNFELDRFFSGVFTEGEYSELINIPILNCSLILESASLGSSAFPRGFLVSESNKEMGFSAEWSTISRTLFSRVGVYKYNLYEFLPAPNYQYFELYYYMLIFSQDSIAEFVDLNIKDMDNIYTYLHFGYRNQITMTRITVSNICNIISGFFHFVSENLISISYFSIQAQLSNEGPTFLLLKNNLMVFSNSYFYNISKVNYLTGGALLFYVLDFSVVVIENMTTKSTFCCRYSSDWDCVESKISPSKAPIFAGNGVTFMINKLYSSICIGCGWGGIISFSTYSKGTLRDVNCFYVFAAELGGIISVESNSEVLIENMKTYYTTVWGGAISFVQNACLMIKNSYFELAGQGLGGTLSWIENGNLYVENVKGLTFYLMGIRTSCINVAGTSTNIVLKNTDFSVVYSPNNGGDFLLIEAFETNIVLENIGYATVFDPEIPSEFTTSKGILILDLKGLSSIKIHNLKIDLAGYMYYRSISSDSLEGIIFKFFFSVIYIEGIFFLSDVNFPRKNGNFFDLGTYSTFFLNGFKLENIRSYEQSNLIIKAEKYCSIILSNLTIRNIDSNANLFYFVVSNKFFINNSVIDLINSMANGLIFSTMGQTKIKITNTNFTNISSTSGNAFYSRIGDECYFDNVHLINISTNYIGGTLILDKESKLEFHNCFLIDLKSGFYGGSLILGSSNEALFRNCYFNRNVALKSNSGIMKLLGGNFVILNSCRLFNNSAYTFAGMISLVSNNVLRIIDSYVYFEHVEGSKLLTGTFIQAEILNSITITKLKFDGIISSLEEGTLIYLNFNNTLRIDNTVFVEGFKLSDQMLYSSLFFSWSGNKLSCMNLGFTNFSNLTTFFKFFYEGSLELDHVYFSRNELSEYIIKFMGSGNFFIFSSGSVSDVITKSGLLFMFESGNNEISFFKSNFKLHKNQHLLRSLSSTISINHINVLNITSSADASTISDIPSIIYLIDGKSLSISSSTFIGFHTHFYMSAISAINSRVYLYRNVFLLNKNSKGFGGTFFFSSYTATDSLTIKNNAFVRNHGLHGGAIFVYQAEKVIIQKNLFKRNLAQRSGNSFNSSIFENFWSNNPAKEMASLQTKNRSMGGALFFDVYRTKSILIQRNNWIGNNADIGGITYFNKMHIPGRAEEIYHNFLENSNNCTGNKAEYQGPIFASNIRSISVQRFAPFKDNMPLKLKFYINFPSKINLFNLVLGVTLPEESSAYFVGVDYFNQIMFYNDYPLQEVVFNKLYMDPTKYSHFLNFYTNQIFPGIYKLKQVGDKISSSSFFRSIEDWQVNISSNQLFSVGPETLESNVTLRINTRNCFFGEFLDSRDYVCRNCEPNFYSFETNFTDRPTSCKKCDINTRYWCLGGAALVPKKGYWRFSSLSSNFYRCPYEIACISNTTSIEGNEGENLISLDISEEMLKGYCAKGYRGFFCASCEKGYGMMAGYICDECDSPMYWFQIILQIFLKSATYFYTIHTGVKLTSNINQSKSDYVLRKNALMKLLLNYSQIIAVLLTLFDISKSLKELFNTIFVSFSPEIGNTFNFDCVINSYWGDISIHYTKTMLLSLFSIFITLLYTLCFYLHKWLIADKTIESPEMKVSNISLARTRPWLIILLLSVYFFYVDLLQLSTQFFNCFDFNKAGENILTDSKLPIRLVRDLDIDCDSYTFSIIRYLVALPMIILIGVVFPAYVFGGIYKIKLRKNQVFRKKDLELGFFTLFFSDKYPYYEMVFLFRKDCIILLNVFIIDFLRVYEPISRQVLIFFMLLFFVSCWIIQHYTQPFKKAISDINRIELLSLEVTSMTLLLLIIDYAQKNQPYYPKVSLGIFSIILTINSYFVLNLLYSFLNNMYRKRLARNIQPRRF